MPSRAELTGLMDAFQAALVARDPGRAPLARGARYTEDGQDLDPGDGFWGTASAVGRYRNDVVDVDTGQIATFASMQENGAGVILVARLKAEGGRISEMETFVARASGVGPMADGPELMDAMGAPDPRWRALIPPGERMSREELAKAANNYFWGLEKNDGKKDYSFFADDCLRWENGRLTTLNPQIRYGEGFSERRSPPGQETVAEIMAGFGAMSARAQFEVGFFAFVDRIRDRRFPVIDVECGTVFAFGFFDHSGTVHRIELSDGRVIDGGVKEPFTWEIGEAFKVEQGKLTRIEAVMRRCPYGMKAGWD